MGCLRTEIDGATAVVTGAGRGIGRAIALALAQKGAKVVTVDIDPDAAVLSAADVGGFAETADVSDRDAVAALAERVEAAHGVPDILVNNAGVGMTGSFLDMSIDDWEWIVGINLMGAIHACKAFGPGMVARGRGQVVNISSGLAYMPTATESAYGATKAGLLAFSQALRADWYAHGVGVSVVCPGIIATDIVRSNTRFRGRRADPETRAGVERLFARGHRPELVAKAAVDAIARNRSMVPVGIEAVVGWQLRRLLPVAVVDLVARSKIGAG